MFPDNKPSFSNPKMQSFFQNEFEKDQENVETVFPQPLECLHGTQIPPFLSKTFDIVDDPCLDPIVSWGLEGVSFVVWDILEFSRTVLPRNFKHNNFSSFVRQLNTYGFRKIDTDKWEFANEGFLRGNRNLLKNIQRRRSSQSQPIGSSIESDKEELQSELEELKKQKSLIMTELVELQKQQHGTTLQMEALNKNLYAAELRQKKMVTILAKLLQNRKFLARLGQNDVQKALTTHRKVKKFLKHQYEPDLENITRTPEFNPTPFEEILEFLVENKVEYTSFVPRHSESILDKGKNMASPQVEVESEYFVSFPEEMEREKKFTEVSSVELGSVVKQEDLWNLDFEDEAGMPGSSRDFLGNFNNYDDMAELGFNSSLSDVWDLGSWPADEFLCPPNFDDPKLDS